MNKTISVWLTVIDGKNAGKIALQKRNEVNSRFSYICQSTWAGKVEDGESVDNAVKRECEEELGKDFADNFDFLSLKPCGESRFLMDDKEWVCSNFLGQISENNLSKVKMHNEAFPGFIFIDKGDVYFSADSAKDPKDNTVLFDDQYEVLKNILK